jgi:hypothetical protein
VFALLRRIGKPASKEREGIRNRWQAPSDSHKEFLVERKTTCANRGKEKALVRGF